VYESRMWMVFSVYGRPLLCGAEIALAFVAIARQLPLWIIVMDVLCALLVPFLLYGIRPCGMVEDMEHRGSCWRL
jgi:hypothetical protein